MTLLKTSSIQIAGMDKVPELGKELPKTIDRMDRGLIAMEATIHTAWLASDVDGRLLFEVQDSADQAFWDPARIIDEGDPVCIHASKSRADWSFVSGRNLADTRGAHEQMVDLSTCRRYFRVHVMPDTNTWRGDGTVMVSCVVALTQWVAIDEMVIPWAS